MGETKGGYVKIGGGSKGAIGSTSRGTTSTEKMSGHRTAEPFKRLLDVEMQMRREKGLYYKCDKKYSIGHICKLQELQVVVCREVELKPGINADEEARSKGSEEGDGSGRALGELCG